MKYAIKAVAALLLLAPMLAMAEEPVVVHELKVPAVLTDAGETFIVQCSDEGFAKARDRSDLAAKCLKLMARWNKEADQRLARKAHPWAARTFASGKSGTRPDVAPRPLQASYRVR
jgi:hypothetical protein